SSCCSSATRQHHPFPTRRSSDLRSARNADLRRVSNGARRSARAAVSSRHAARQPRRPSLAGAVVRLTRTALARPIQKGGFSLKEDRKSTRLKSSQDQISYAVFCW